MTPKIVAGVKITRTIADGMELFRKGSRVLAKMQTNGIKIDTDYIKKAKRDADKRVIHIEKELVSNPKHRKVIRPWKRRFGAKFNLQSKQQLGEIFYKELGYKPTEHTDKGAARTNEAALSQIDHPFIPDYFQIAKLKKAITTLKGIEREVDDRGFLHPFFHLNTVRTYRSSSSEPNFQNFQVRIAEMAKMIRDSFVSRFRNGRLIENDFKTLEVAIAACYHRDPRMLRHLRTGYDYHREMASRLYMCTPDQVSKMTRYAAKNKFVFPEFYGSYYKDCAKNLYDFIREGKLEVDGIPMVKWLKRHGIHELGRCDKKADYTPKKGTFERHVQEVEDHFWNVEYPTYTKWKKRWYNAYLETGEIPMFTGFVVRGEHSRNDVINYPVQGAAFHCLLWTAIEVEKELRKRGMRTKLIGQIHDCMLADVPDDETQAYLKLVHHIVSVKLPQAWDWIIAPMEVEAEVSPIGGTWNDKKQWTMQNGIWQLAA